MDQMFRGSTDRKPNGGRRQTAPEPSSAGRTPWRVSLSAPSEIVLTVGSAGFLDGGSSLRLEAAGARKLAGQLLAYAGALDGSGGD